MPTDKIIMEYTGPWTVKLTYFKQSGKYYSEGEYTSHRVQLFEIFDEVHRLAELHALPGLIEGHSDFHVLIDVPDHPHRYPHLIVAVEQIKEAFEEKTGETT